MKCLEKQRAHEWRGACFSVISEKLKREKEEKGITEDKKFLSYAFLRICVKFSSEELSVLFLLLAALCLKFLKEFIYFRRLKS